MSEREEMIEYHEEHDKSVRIFAEAKQNSERPYVGGTKQRQKAEQKKVRDILDKIDEIVGEREGVSLDVGYLNDADYSLDQAEAEIQALIDQEVKKARIDELNELNYQIAKNSWHKENAYKMYPYILDRIAELEKDNK